METLPSEAARALADALRMHADTLDSLDLNDVVAALPAVRAAARQLGDVLEDRGWGADVLYGWPAPQDDEENYESGYGDGEAGDWDVAEDLLGDYDEDDVEEPALNGARISYQARFDFVIFDEDALRARAEARCREVNPEADAEAGMAEFGGPLGLLLYLDNPTFRAYETAGVEMVYGQEVVRPVERTLDQFGFDEQEDNFPVD